MGRELALERLSSVPREAIVIEDSRNGLLAATGAGLACLVTVSSYTANEDFSEAALRRWMIARYSRPAPRAHLYLAPSTATGISVE